MSTERSQWQHLPMAILEQTAEELYRDFKRDPKALRLTCRAWSTAACKHFCAWGKMLSCSQYIANANAAGQQLPARNRDWQHSRYWRRFDSIRLAAAAKATHVDFVHLRHLSKLEHLKVEDPDLDADQEEPVWGHLTMLNELD